MIHKSFSPRSSFFHVLIPHYFFVKLKIEICLKLGNSIQDTCCKMKKSLSQSDSFTATLLCSATRYKRGVLRHNSVLIQLISYIHLGYMPDLSSFLSYGATEQVSLLRFKTLPVTLRGLQTTCSNKNNRFKIDIRFRFRWYQ